MPVVPGGDESGGSPPSGGSGPGIGPGIAGAKGGAGSDVVLPLPVLGVGTAFTTRRINRNNEVNQAATYATVREAAYGVPVDELSFEEGMGLEMLDDSKDINMTPVEGAPGASGASNDERRGKTPMPGRVSAKRGNPFDGMGSM